MYIYQSVNSAYKGVLKSVNNKKINYYKERIINDSIHYGKNNMYTYTDDIIKAGIKLNKNKKQNKNPLFTHINTKQLYQLLNYLYERDGFLVSM